MPGHRTYRRYTPSVRLRLEMARYVTAEDYVRALEEAPLRESTRRFRAWTRYRCPRARRWRASDRCDDHPVGATREPVRNVMLEA
jgi:hypothetical protein